MQMQMSLHNKKEELDNKLDTKETNHEKEVPIIYTGTSIDHQQNVATTDQPVGAETNCDNNNQEINEMIVQEDEVTILLSKHVYEGRKKKARTSSFFSKVTSRNKLHLEGQQGDTQISVPNVSRETVSTKSSSLLQPKRKRHGRDSQTLPESSSRSVPRKRNRKSGIQEIEDSELNSRRLTYLSGKFEESPSIFDHAPKQFHLVDEHISYKESLLKFAKNLGPTAQMVVFLKLNQLSSDETKAHAFQAPVPHPSSARRLSDDPKGKSLVMDRGTGKNYVSAGDERPVGLFDRVVTGRAHIASFPDASEIQRSALQQQYRPPSNAPVTNAYTGHGANQVPIAYKARPLENSYPWTTFRPSRLSGLCHSSGSGFGVWDGHQVIPLNELKSNANPAALEQGFQQTSHNSHMQLQNQLESEARQQQMRLEQQPLPLLSNMFDAGPSHAGTSSAAPNHRTTSNAAQSGQELPLAQKSDINLELQLGTKPL